MRDYDDIYVGYKIRLHPTEEQKRIFDLYYRGSIYVYNYGIKLCEQAGKELGYEYSILSKFSLVSAVDKLKYQEGYEWLNMIGSETLKYAAFDLNKANNYLKNKTARKPRWKYYNENYQQFSIRADRLQICKDKIYVPSTKELPIGYVACDNPYDEIIGKGNKDSKRYKYIHYYNTRIIYDGLDYYLTLSIQFNLKNDNTPNLMKKCSLNEDWAKKPIDDEAIGIDMGCKEDNWFVLSNGRRVHRPNTTKEERKVRKLQKQMERQRRINDKKYKEKMSKSADYAAGEPLPKREKSNHEKKTYREFRKYHSRIVHKKEAVIHNLACDLVKMKPKAVVMEDLHVSNMLLKGSTKIGPRYVKKHNHQILSACIDKSITIIQRKCENNGVLFIQAPDDYPSSQLCSNCGERIQIGSRRVFHCPNCGMKMDRDLNAAKNLENYFYENFEPIPFVTFGKVS